jgi:hypothetical protein
MTVRNDAVNRIELSPSRPELVCNLYAFFEPITLRFVAAVMNYNTLACRLFSS